MPAFVGAGWDVVDDHHRCPVRGRGDVVTEKATVGPTTGCAAAGWARRLAAQRVMSAAQRMRTSSRAQCSRRSAPMGAVAAVVPNVVEWGFDARLRPSRFAVNG